MNELNSILNERSECIRLTARSNSFNEKRFFQYITTINHLIKLNYHNCDFTVQQLTEPLPMSQRTLQRQFKDYMGLTLGEYLRQYRLMQAKQKLLQQELIAHVAFDVGYATAAHFCKVFKDRFNMTPHEYRIRYTRRYLSKPDPSCVKFLTHQQCYTDKWQNCPKFDT